MRPKLIPFGSVNFSAASDGFLWRMWGAQSTIEDPAFCGKFGQPLSNPKCLTPEKNDKSGQELPRCKLCGGEPRSMRMDPKSVVGGQLDTQLMLAEFGTIGS